MIIMTPTLECEIECFLFVNDRSIRIIILEKHLISFTRFMSKSSLRFVLEKFTSSETKFHTFQIRLNFRLIVTNVELYSFEIAC